MTSIERSSLFKVILINMEIYTGDLSIYKDHIERSMHVKHFRQKLRTILLIINSLISLL